VGSSTSAYLYDQVDHIFSKPALRIGKWICRMVQNGLLSVLTSPSISLGLFKLPYIIALINDTLRHELMQTRAEWWKGEKEKNDTRWFFLLIFIFLQLIYQWTRLYFDSLSVPCFKGVIECFWFWGAPCIFFSDVDQADDDLSVEWNINITLARHSRQCLDHNNTEEVDIDNIQIWFSFQHLKN
jgi:hypothetical protein